MSRARDFVMITLTTPEYVETAKPLLVLIAGITVYAIFIFKFYKYMATRDIFSLKDKYGKSSFTRHLLYFLEHIVLVPLLMFFWFAVIAAFMILISDMDTGTIIMIAAGMVAAVRVTSYYNESISQDLAKLIPLSLIVVFITDPASITWTEYVSTLESIPNLLETLGYYILVLSPLEFCMRIVYGIASRKP
jgi:hypothetical protein